MTKKEYCLKHPSIAYFSGFSGLEIHGIEYGIDDYVIFQSGAWGSPAIYGYHKAKIGFDGTCYENIILTGNRDFTGHTIPEWDSILQVFDEAAEDLESLENGTNEYFKNATELIRYHFPESEYRPAGKFYSTRDIHNIREMLSALTGKEWYERQLSGCCQGDWIDCIYPADVVLYEYDRPVYHDTWKKV